MDTHKSRSVLRYFMPADAFVRILVRDGGDAALRARPGLNRAAYRRVVIEACCPEYRGDPVGRLIEQCPLDPIAAEDLLYQLCIEVNPSLDIHSVRLVEHDGELAAGTATQSTPREDHRRQRFLRRRARSIEQRLARRIIGQDDALATVGRAVRRVAAGLSREGRPLATFLFLGRTGTGKTELAKQLARELFGSRGGQHLVRIDCSELGQAHEYAKLIGAPPGYVGHEHGGALTEAVRKTPDCVVLFDEVEKAHPRLHQLLLQVLDEGHLTDGRGRRTDFSRAFVVMTSNVGAIEMQDSTRRVGFTSNSLDSSTMREITSRALEAQFAPEFLARIDEQVVFRELDRCDAQMIAHNLLADLALRARNRRVRVAFAPSVASWVAERGFAPDTGARELRRVIEREIEARLADRVLDDARPAGLLRASIRKGALVLREAA
jgi:ATP-dependent Clp protease ATP-binding subunit ClpC